MGPSGAGKTTLLNVLSGRFKTNVTGSLRFNEVTSRRVMKRYQAYVLQSESFFNNLTAKQHLYYITLLRVPQDIPLKRKKAIVCTIPRLTFV